MIPPLPPPATREALLDLNDRLSRRVTELEAALRRIREHEAVRPPSVQSMYTLFVADSALGATGSVSEVITLKDICMHGNVKRRCVECTNEARAPEPDRVLSNVMAVLNEALCIGDADFDPVWAARELARRAGDSAALALSKRNPNLKRCAACGSFAIAGAAHTEECPLRHLSAAETPALQRPAVVNSSAIGNPNATPVVRVPRSETAKPALHYMARVVLHGGRALSFPVLVNEGEAKSLFDVIYARETRATISFEPIPAVAAVPTGSEGT